MVEKDMTDIKYPDRYDQGIYGMCMEESTQGDWVACSDIADYLIDVMNNSGNDAEKMSDEISKFVDYLLR